MVTSRTVDTYERPGPMKRPFLYLLAISCTMLAFATGCSSKKENSPRNPAVLALKGNVENGTILHKRDCSGCHGLDGKSGSAGENTVSVAKSDANEFLNYVIDGEDSMPSFGSRYNDQNLADLLAYVKSLP